MMTNRKWLDERKAMQQARKAAGLPTKDASARETQARYRKRVKDKVRGWINGVKLDRGCDVCGYADDSRRLWWVGPPGDSAPSVSRLVADGRSVDAIAARMSQCRLLCVDDQWGGGQPPKLVEYSRPASFVPYGRDPAGYPAPSVASVQRVRAEGAWVTTPVVPDGVDADEFAARQLAGAMARGKCVAQAFAATKAARSPRDKEAAAALHRDVLASAVLEWIDGTPERFVALMEES